MESDEHAKLESWARQPRSMKKQRSALKKQVLNDTMDFNKAKEEAAKLERRWLIECVRDGKISSTKVEKQAEKLGCAPLIPPPDPGQFDPMFEIYWTLHMV